jgi:uncharacterized small protein (DUF1192 family)
MDEDELISRSPALKELTREDLERYSKEELRQRIATLEAEIARVRKALEGKGALAGAADALFRRT